MFLPLFHLDLYPKIFVLISMTPKNFQNQNLLFFGAFVAPFNPIFPLPLRFVNVRDIFCQIQHIYENKSLV